MLAKRHVRIPIGEARGRSLLHLPETQADVWYAWVDSCARSDLEAYESLLNAQERARLRRFPFPSLEREYLVTRALCRLTLSRYAPVAPADWTFIQNGYGRPEIHPRFSTRLRFNLSNCRTLVACVVTAQADAGIDVENVDRPAELLSLADRHFCSEEVRLLQATPHAERLDRFLQLWTLKESYIKARGMGHTLPLEESSFDLSGPHIRVCFAPALHVAPAGWQFALYRLGEQHRMAICIHNGSTDETMAIKVREGLQSLANAAPSPQPECVDPSVGPPRTYVAGTSVTLLRTSVATSSTRTAARKSSS
jgi:4'-phosphopantetheinyl transferase